MTIAIIEENKVLNLIICENAEFARELFPGAICVVYSGYAIGDAYHE